MLRRLMGVVKQWFKKDEGYKDHRNLTDYTYAGPIKITINPNRGLLRSVDRRLGYRKDRSQTKNWKKWKCR